MLRTKKKLNSAILLDANDHAIVIRADQRKGGSEPGGWVSITENTSEDDQSIEYLAKKDSLENVVRSKIILDLYKHFAYAPASRIILLDAKMATGLLTTFFEKEMDAQAFAEGGKISSPSSSKLRFFDSYFSPKNPQSEANVVPFLLSEKIVGYHDLGEELVEQIRKTGQVPETITYKGAEGLESIDLPLIGFMRIAALAKSLEDCDWLGSSGGNTGFTVERHENGYDIAKVILVDEKALTPVRLHSHATTRDIIIGAQSDIYIKYDSLSASQKEEFLSTLLSLHQLREKDFMAFFPQKEYEALFSPYFSSEYFSSLMKQLKETIAKQCALYEKDLKEFSKKAMHIYAREGDIEGLTGLIHLNHDLNQPKFNKMTPLLIAAKHNQAHAIKYLVAAQVKTNAKGKRGFNALHYAVINSNEHMLSTLIAINHRMITQKDDKGETPLNLAKNLAIKNYNWKMVVMMLLKLNKNELDEETKESLKKYSNSLDKALKIYQGQLYGKELKLMKEELDDKENALSNILNSSQAVANRLFKEAETVVSSSFGATISSLAMTGFGFSKNNKGN